jgi:hypothetical protein
MKIACLAWGSLYWDPRELLVTPPWVSDGPTLPIEYVRQSSDNHLTLVVTKDGAPVPTLWALMPVANLAEAVESLRMREGRYMNESRVGRWPHTTAYPYSAEIGAWAQKKELDAVVWTALPPKFRGTDGLSPTLTEAIAHLSSLQGASKDIAEQYVRRTPAVVSTPFRTAFEKQFGWVAT